MSTFEPAKIVGDEYPVNSHLPIYRSYSKLHGVLGLYVSNECNIRCAHCCTDSAPGAFPRLDVSLILRQVEDARAERPITALHVSGGEPFLHSSLLKEIATYCRENALALAVNSNAFWATTPSQAKKILDIHHGITQLILSADDYHEVYIPLDRVALAAQAGVEAGLHVQICFCTPAAVRAPIVDRLLNKLPKPIRSRVSVAITPVELGGRANKLPEAHWRPLTTEIPPGSCSLINRPVILEDGRVQACCNTTLREQLSGTPLDLGNVKERELISLLVECASDQIIQSLRYFGPAFLASLLPQKRRKELSEEIPRGDICSLCSRMMSKPEVVKELRESLKDESAMRLLNVAQLLTKET